MLRVRSSISASSPRIVPPASHQCGRLSLHQQRRRRMTMPMVAVASSTYNDHYIASYSPRTYWASSSSSSRRSSGTISAWAMTTTGVGNDHVNFANNKLRDVSRNFQRRTKVFVSRHNRTLHDTTSASSIISYVKSKLPHLVDNNDGNSHADGMSDFRITSSHVVVKTCPLCSKSTGGKMDNCYKLYVAIGSGAYYCHRCGSNGSWYDFKNELSGGLLHGGGRGGINKDGRMDGSDGGNRVDRGYRRTTDGGASSARMGGSGGGGGGGGVAPLPMPPKRLNSIYVARLFENDNKRDRAQGIDGNRDVDEDGGKSTSSSTRYNVNGTDNDDGDVAMHYLTRVRGLNRDTLRKYGVGCARYNFPDISAKKTNTNNGNGDGNGGGGGGMSYVSSACVTFPWMMRAGEVEQLEGMRGSRYEWRTKTVDPPCDISEAPHVEKDDGTSSSFNATTMTTIVSTTRNEPKGDKKPIAEMTPLERYHHRKERKERRNRGEAKRKEEEGRKGGLCQGGVDEKEGEEDDDDDDDDDDEAAVVSQRGPFVARRIKARSIERKSWQRLDPPGGGSGLFGWHTVPHDASEIIITEGEFDAMAVYQATGRAAVSLPNGCRSFPTDILALMERFDTVYIWMDNDGPGREGAETFAKKLGVERCLVVRPSGKRGWGGGKARMDANDGDDAEKDHEIAASDSTPTPTPTPPPPKDANEALLTGWDIGELLGEAAELPHERILKFSDLRDQVIHEIVNPERYRGAPIPSLPGFTHLVKGFRRGEMTVLTGPTGSGKTTFLGQISLDLAEQGVNVLWGSFEIKNTRLMHKLLQQYMRDVLPMGLADRENISEAEKRQQMIALTALADKFETLPMHFMKFHGGSDIDHVLDAMEYAAYVHDVDHIILDNMQFMISRAASANRKGNSSYDKFDMQDLAIEKFRKFATDYNVHVSLVVHPRKEDEGAKLGISSFYGSAKATQEADTVLILQSDGKRKFVDVRKNRFDGTLGHVPLYFERKSGRYSETSPDVNAQPTTSIPKGISAVNSAKARHTGVSAASASSTYGDIRNQHPV